MKNTSREFIVGVIIGIAIGAVFSYALATHDNTSWTINTCPVVNHETLMKYRLMASPTSGEATAKAMEKAYLEQHSPNYPLELLRRMYRDVPGKKKFIGLSYVFANDTLLYGHFSITNETPSEFEFASPTRDMSQRVDGAGLITPKWAVIFVSLYDTGGRNDIEELRLFVPSTWRLKYYGGSGTIIAGNVLRVRFSKWKRNNYVVLAFETNGIFEGSPEIEVVVDGDSYRLLRNYSST